MIPKRAAICQNPAIVFLYRLLPACERVIRNSAASFRFRDFRLLWASSCLYSLATGMEQVSVGWLIFELTGSPFMVGVGGAARMLPFFVLGLFSGVVADRWERRMLLRAGTLAAAAAALVMALLLMSGFGAVWFVIALVTVLGGLLAFTLTVRSAFTYDIVGHQYALNGLAIGAMANQGGGIAGSLISGALIELLGPGWQFVAVGACYLGSALVILAIRNPGRAARPGGAPALDNLLGYIRIVRANRTLLVLMLLTATTEVFGFTHITLLPVLAREVVQVGAAGLGALTAARQAGGLLGLWLLAALGFRSRRGLLTLATAIGFGCGQMAFYFAGGMYSVLGALLFVNACAMAVDTLYKTLMQDQVADAERGRAMGAWVLSVGVAPVGHLGVGALAGVLGAPGALLINGAVLAAVSVAAGLGLPGIRRLE